MPLNPSFRRSLALLLPLLVTTSTTAFAQPRDPGAGDTLFRSAREAMARGDFATACPRFAESQRLDPAPGTLLNVAACEEAEGKVATSYAHFAEVIDGLRNDDFRVAFARDHMAKLGPRLPMLTVTLAKDSAGAHVLRDDVELRSGSFGVDLPVDPGTHVLVVRAGGRPDTRQEITLVEGQRLAVELHVGSGAATAQVVQATPLDDRSRTYSLAAFTVGGLGMAAGFVSTILFKSAADTYHRHCDATGCDPDGLSAASRAKTFNMLSPIAFLIGAAGIGAGSYFLLTPKKSAPPRMGRFDIHPYVAPSLAGLSVSGTL